VHRYYYSLFADGHRLGQGNDWFSIGVQARRDEDEAYEAYARGFDLKFTRLALLFPLNFWQVLPQRYLYMRSISFTSLPEAEHSSSFPHLCMHA
jgi:hypothetical protein